jgi:hypothetical protein
LQIHIVSKTEYQNSLAEDALNDPTELRKNVKRILGVIVSLLKDRVTIGEEPTSKKRHIEEIFKKK